MSKRDYKLTGDGKYVPWTEHATVVVGGVTAKVKSAIMADDTYSTRLELSSGRGANFRSILIGTEVLDAIIGGDIAVALADAAKLHGTKVTTTTGDDLTLDDEMTLDAPAPERKAVPADWPVGASLNGGTWLIVSEGVAERVK